MADDPVDSETTETADDTLTDEAAEVTTDDEAIGATEAPTDDAEVTADAKDDAKDGAADDTKAAAAPVVRKKVVSKRVTPKAGAAGKDGAPSGPTKPRTKVSAKEEEHSYSKRYTPPAAQYKAGPSPWWVPALMFGLIIIGALVIMLNYMQVFGDPKNIRLVIGLGFILGGIVTATQYR